MIKNNVLEILSCPTTGEDLKNDNGLFKSSTISYPTLDGVPCLYDELENTVGEWSLKIKSYLAEEDSHLKHIQNMINLEPSQLARKRLSSQHEARSKNKKVFEKFLHLFLKGDDKEAVYSTQQIHSYFPNIFRDWCWGGDEIDASLKAFENIDFADKRVLILGSGAGGFSYQLASKNLNGEFISLEHNPFLALLSSHIMQGKDVKLFEFSNYPNSIENTAAKRHISGIAPIENHDIILGSFPNLPFKDESFDYIIAPWFFDILDMPYRNALYCAQDFLKESGTLIAFGPSNVHSKDLSKQLSKEELLEIYKSLFENVETSSEHQAYLNSPLDSQLRTEHITTFVASKKTKGEPSFEPILEALKFDAAFERYKSEQTVKAKILNFIESDITAEELALILEREFGLTPEESPRYALKFIQQIQFDY